MSSSTYLFIQLLISAWTNVYLFYTLMSNPVLCFYFIVYIAPTDHWKGFQIGTVCFLSTSLLSGTKRCSRLILYFLCPSCRLFPRFLLSGELYLETRMWVLCVLTAIWCHFFQALSVTELVNRCVYTNPCIYTYL